MIKYLTLGSLLLTTTLMACPTGTQVLVENGQNYCLLSGKYLNSSLNLTSDFTYRLDDEGVFIGGDNKNISTLRIQSRNKDRR